MCNHNTDIFLCCTEVITLHVHAHFLIIHFEPLRRGQPPYKGQHAGPAPEYPLFGGFTINSGTCMGQNGANAKHKTMNTVAGLLGRKQKTVSRTCTMDGHSQ